jgi:hypothetical protein
MCDAQHVEKEHQEEARGSEFQARHAWNRRSILSGAASGFALATSELLLPEWLVAETEAAEHPVRRIQGRADQQRKKQRHRRAHRREVQRRDNGNDQDRAPRGAAHYKWIWFYVYNDRPVTTPNQSASVQGWANKGGITDHYQKVSVLPVSVANGTYHAFDFRDNEAATVVIDDYFWVNADNSNALPFAPVVLSMGYGGTMTKFGPSDKSTWVEDTHILAENEQIVVNMDGHRFTVKRLYDTNDYKFFDIHFT